MKKSVLPNKKRAGFTLLELLVVISIIGILLALGVVAFTTAQRKGRDAKRRADIKSIQDGFEQYYHGSAVAGGPPRLQYAATCATMYTSDNFPAGAPLDPKEGAYSCSSSATAYCACAALETGGGNATNGSCAGYGTTTNGTHYCLRNLQ